MGIDPVTHAPRLDFLDLQSIISSSLCNQSILNMSNFLGTQALMNPELLKLATAILSLKQQNQVPFPKHRQDQLCNSLSTTRRTFIGDDKPTHASQCGSFW